MATAKTPLETIREIQQTSLFRHVSDADLEELAKRARISVPEEGEEFVKQGEFGPEFAILVGGEASLLCHLPGGNVFSVETLKVGRSVDLGGILENRPWNMSARARGDTVVLWVDKELLHAALKRDENNYAYLSRMALEPAIQLFTKPFKYGGDVTFEDLRELVLALETQDFPTGAVIQKQGAKVEFVYIKRSGEVRERERRRGESGKARAHAIRQIEVGGLFGAQGLRPRKLRSRFSYRAESPTSTWRLPVAGYLAFVKKYPFIATLYDGHQETPLAESKFTATATIMPQLELAAEQFDDDTFNYSRDPKYRRRFPIIYQHDEMDCGAACLAMVAKYHGVDIGIHAVRERVGVGVDGASMYGVATAAEQTGFLTRGLQVDAEELDDIHLPAITNQGYHFVVIYDVTSTHVVLGDPALGLRKVPRKEFGREWSGAVLLLNPTPEFFRLLPEAGNYAIYSSLLKPYRGDFLRILTLSLLLNVLTILGPLFTQLIMDGVVPTRDHDMLRTLSIGALATISLIVAADACRRYLMNFSSLKLDTEMGAQFMRHLMSLQYKFFATRRTGDILMRLQDIHYIQNFVTSRGIEVLIDGVMLIFYCAALFWYHTGVGCAFLGILAIFLGASRVIGARIQRNLADNMKHAGEAQTLLVESLKNMATVKSFTSETPNRWKWEDSYTRANIYSFRIGNWVNILSTFIEFLHRGAPLGILLFCASRVFAGEMTIGKAVALSSIFTMALSPIVTLATVFSELQQLIFGLKRLSDIFLSAPEERRDSRAYVTPGKVKGAVQFERVSFRYGNEESPIILDQVSFEVYPGQSAAFVGRSGSGKSSIMHLINRLHDPFDGRILLDGLDVKNFRINELRKLVGLVSQDTRLFSGTILANISLGDPHPDMEKAIRAAEIANADEFIRNQPQDYHTKLFEDGAGLSGGQKQRISIARALYHDPRILILDEATSALDSESEAAFHESLKKIGRTRTIIHIAHRMNTVAACDRIFVVDNGRIIESGTHSELLGANTAYAHLVRSSVR